MSAPPQPRPLTAPSVFTANRLRDGRVVWFGAGESWLEDIAAALIVAPAAADATLARARLGEARQEVIGVYAVEVAPAPEGPVPVRIREKLRLAGPSIAAVPDAWRMAS